MNAQVIAVVVTYEPDPNILKRLLHSVVMQVKSVIIVDNGSKTDFSFLNSEQRCGHPVSLIRLSENKGVAFAQNRGIELAKQRQAQYVLLMDQDSIPESGMVQTLLSAAIKKAAGAVGPRYLDVRQNNPPPFIRISGFKLERCVCPTSDTIVPVDYLVSSGCLIPLSVLDRVGGMKEDYFIDYVDIEWGLRARRFGYQCYGVCGAYMSHCLGNEPIKFFDKLFPSHDPLRHYYHFRNAVLLSKEPWVPANWKIVNIRSLCLKYFFYSFFTKQRLKHWQMMTLGILHGLKGKAGQYSKG
ncbi:MAG: glycosyltransferase family 2 protein [Phycisphaerae bacterium]|jgi:rhamnosyltransferase